MADDEEHNSNMRDYNYLVSEYTNLEEKYKVFKIEYLRLMKLAVSVGDTLSHITSTVELCDHNYEHIKSKFQEYKNYHITGTLFNSSFTMNRMRLFTRILKRTTEVLDNTRNDMHDYYVKYYAPIEAQQQQDKIQNYTYILLGAVVLFGAYYLRYYY